jgi:hypothetical protein
MHLKTRQEMQTTPPNQVELSDDARPNGALLNQLKSLAFNYLENPGQKPNLPSIHVGLIKTFRTADDYMAPKKT